MSAIDKSSGSSYLNNIKELQEIEKKMFLALENKNLNEREKRKLVTDINNVSNLRNDLYSHLNDINESYNNVYESTSDVLKQQQNAIVIVEKELNNSKLKLQSLKDEKNNKMRMVQINQYYNEQYTEHANLLKLLIMVFVPIIIISILRNKGMIPMNIYMGLLVIITFLGSIKIIKKYISIMMRSKLNYQDYDWYFDKKSAPKNDKNSSDGNYEDPWKSSKAATNYLSSCVGEECCGDNQTYDASINQCISNDNLRNIPSYTDLFDYGVRDSYKDFDATLNNLGF